MLQVQRLYIKTTMIVNCMWAQYHVHYLKLITNAHVVHQILYSWKVLRVSTAC